MIFLFCVFTSIQIALITHHHQPHQANGQTPSHTQSAFVCSVNRVRIWSAVYEVTQPGKMSVRRHLILFMHERKCKRVSSSLKNQISSNLLLRLCQDRRESALSRPDCKRALSSQSTCQVPLPGMMFSQKYRTIESGLVKYR